MNYLEGKVNSEMVKMVQNGKLLGIAKTLTTKSSTWMVDKRQQNDKGDSTKASIKEHVIAAVLKLRSAEQC